jgi:glucosamine-6-phosphate deaminase
LKILVAHDIRVFAKLAFGEIISLVEAKPNACLGLATGSTPLFLYGWMVDDHRRNGTDYSRVKTFNLDEYVGFGPEDEESYVSFMRKNLFDGIEIPYENTHFLNGLAPNPGAECERYSRLLEKNPVDVQILGIGRNGHIAFNEPGTPFDSKAHAVDLSIETVRDNSRFFQTMSDTPTQALTMGITEIMRAKKIIVMACGANKANAVYNMVERPVTEECPASVLRRHGDCMLILDDAAASKLTGDNKNEREN